MKNPNPWKRERELWRNPQQAPVVKAFIADEKLATATGCLVKTRV